MGRARSPRRRVARLADGRRVEALRWAGAGLPLVLLHGLLDSADGWAELAAGTSRPCVAVDLPGFGGSDPPAHPAFSAYAADVVAAFETVDVHVWRGMGHHPQRERPDDLAHLVDAVCATVDGGPQDLAAAG